MAAVTTSTSFDDERERKPTKRRARTETLRTLATGRVLSLDDDDAPGFARHTLSVTTKTKLEQRLRQKRLVDAIVASPEKLDAWEGSAEIVATRSWTRARVQPPPGADQGDNVKQSLRMDELKAMKSSISEVPIFKQCSPKFVEAIAEQVRHALFTPGTDIMVEGEHGDSMYILHRGDVEVLIGGNRVCTLSDGAVFGEIAALCKNPVLARRTATIRAITLCDCRMTERDSLLKIVSRFKADEDILMKKLEARFAELRGMGKLPNKKEWWRVEVKSANENQNQSNAASLISKVRASLPAISALNAARAAAAKNNELSKMKTVPDEESASVASTPNPDEKNTPRRGQLDFPVWALEAAAKRTQSADRTDTLSAPSSNSPRQVSSRRRSSYNWQRRTPSTGPSSSERPRKPRSKRSGHRGPTCISSVALLRAEDEELGYDPPTAAHEWYDSTRAPRGLGGPMPPALPPPDSRCSARRHHSAGVRSLASPPPKLRDIRDIRTPRT